MSRGTSKTIQSSKTPSDIFDPTNFTFNQDSPFFRESDVRQDAAEDRRMMMAFKDIPFDHTDHGRKNSFTGISYSTGASFNNPLTASPYTGREGLLSTHLFSLGGYSSQINSNATNNFGTNFADYLQCPEWRFSDSGDKFIFSFRSKLDYRGHATGIAVLGTMTLATNWDVSTIQKNSLQIVELPDTANSSAIGSFNSGNNIYNLQGYYRPYYKIRFGDNGLKMYLMETSGRVRGGGNDTRIFQYTLASAFDITQATYDGYQDFAINGLFNDQNPILNFEIVPHPEAALNSTWSMIYFFGPRKSNASQSEIAIWSFNNSGRWDITNAINIGSGPSTGTYWSQLPGLGTTGVPRYVRDIFFADSGNKLFVVAAPGSGGGVGGQGVSLWGWDLTTSSASYVDQYNIFNSTKTSIHTGSIGGTLTKVFTSGVWNGLKAHDLFEGFKPLTGGGGDITENAKSWCGHTGTGACFQFNSTGTKLVCNDLATHSAEGFAPRVLEYDLSTAFDPMTLSITDIRPRIGFGFQVVGVAPKETYNHKYIAWTPPSFGHSWKGQHNTGHLGFYLIEFEDNDSYMSTVDAYGPAIDSVTDDSHKYKIKYISNLHPNGIISDGTTNTDLPLCARMKPDGTQLWVFTIKNKDATAAAQSASIKYYTLSTPWDISTLSSSPTGSFSFNLDGTGLYTDLKPRDYVYMWFNNTGTQLCMSNMPFENADQTQSAGSVLLINLPQPWALSPGLASVERIDNLQGSSGSFFGQEGNYVTAAEFTKDGKALWFQLDPIGAGLNSGERSSLNLLHLDTPNDITTINTSNNQKMSAVSKVDLYFGYEPRSTSIGRSATSSDGLTVALEASPRYSGWGYSVGRPPANYSCSIATKSSGALLNGTGEYTGFSIGDDPYADSYRGLPVGMYGSGLAFSSDGRRVFTNDMRYIYQYDLERPFDIQSRFKYSGTGSLLKDNATSGYGAYENRGSIFRPIAFNADGTRVFWTRMFDDHYNRLSLFSRDLSTPWDVTSATGDYRYWYTSSDATYSGTAGGDTGGIGQYDVVSGYGGMTHFEFSPDGRKIIMNWTYASGPSYQANYIRLTSFSTLYFVLNLPAPYFLPNQVGTSGTVTIFGISSSWNLVDKKTITNLPDGGDFSTVFTMNSTGDKLLSFDPVDGKANAFSLATPYVFGTSANGLISSKTMYPSHNYINREQGPISAEAFAFSGIARVGIDKLMLVRHSSSNSSSWGVIRDGNNARRTIQSPVDLIDLNGTYGFMG